MIGLVILFVQSLVFAWFGLLAVACTFNLMHAFASANDHAKGGWLTATIAYFCLCLYAATDIFLTVAP